jgi:acyl carrier protein
MAKPISAIAVNFGDAVMSQLSERSLRESILQFLAPKLTEIGPEGIDDDANLMGSVLIDSAELLELIVWVEENVQVEFTPDDLNLEDGVTIRQLINAFPLAKTLANGSSHG